jgi:hypothetical protein
MSKAWMFVLLGSMSGCTCSRAGGGSAVDADGGAGLTVLEASAPVTVGASDPRYSAPIAAGRAEGGDLFVAGLVVPAGAIELTRLTADGVGADAGRRVAWTKPVMTGVKWAADAELSVQPLGPGLAVTWEGLRAGKQGRFVQLVTVDGEPHGDVFPVDGSVCTTRTELAWPEQGPHGTRIVARSWDGASHEVARLAADREPTLACGATKIFATGEGDDDVTLALPATPTAGDAAHTVRLIGASDFSAKDDERSHELYTWGDQLGVVRVGASGALARREVGDVVSAWTASPRPLAEDDDVEAVDADAHATYVVWTHDDEEACGDSGASASSVHVRVLPRAPGNVSALGDAAPAPVPARAAAAVSTESDVQLAPTDCSRDVGPFWTASLGDDLIIAWAERTSRQDKTTAPIAALSYRRMRGAEIVAQGKVEAHADALVSAGCDPKAGHCYAAALTRAAGTDVMAPEAARVLQYP